MPAKKTRRSQLIVVFDGHGGRKVAEWAAELLPEELQRNLRVDGWGDALKRAFPAVDAELRRRRDNDSMGRDASGSTVLAALFDGRDAFHVASLGDCRAVLAEKDGYVNCSNDCRADRPDEIARVVRAGGFVANKRVNGQIAVSRALGDFAFKGGALGDRVSCVPDLTSVKLRDGDDFLLLGCDGLDWYRKRGKILYVYRETPAVMVSQLHFMVAEDQDLLSYMQQPSRAFHSLAPPRGPADDNTKQTTNYKNAWKVMKTA